MTNEERTKMTGYEYILAHPNGSLSELDEIDSHLADYFASAGIIAFGINSRANRRYQVTPVGKKIAEIELISLKLKMLKERHVAA